MHRPGGCAELVTAPVSVVYPRPADMNPVLASLTEPAANGVHAMRLLPTYTKKSVFVFGAGMIGLMVLQAARALCDSRVAVADLQQGRLECARALGAERVVNPSHEDVVNEGIAFSGADGADYVVDAVGTDATKLQSLKIGRPGGAVCWLGLGGDDVRLKSYDVTLPGKTIVGSYNSSDEEFLEAGRLLHEGRMKSGKWVKTFPLEDAASVFQRMCAAAGDDIKAVILP